MLFGETMHNANRYTRLFALLTALFLLCATCPLEARAESKLNIMTATTDLAALAQEVGGDRVGVESIARGYQDPHFVDAKPSFLLKLKRAELLIVVCIALAIGWGPPFMTHSTTHRRKNYCATNLDESRHDSYRNQHTVR